MNHELQSRYSIPALTETAYNSFPEYELRPVIGITANHEGIDATLREAYCQQIIKAGGIPVIIPPVTDVAVCANTLARIDALILSGGGDYNPLWCGEQPSPLLHNINSVRDSAELLITRLAANRQMPMLGICRGMQTLAMALGGHVAQDLSDAVTDGKVTVKHSQDADRSEATHTVTVTENSALYNIYKETTLYVNSFHHQVVDDAGEYFSVTARSADGLIEAMEAKGGKQVMGVQWHPEWLGEEGLTLFRWLTDAATIYRKACTLHDGMATLDTHCDTPMFFHQGVDFIKRDPRILMDLHKMTDGRLDATTMVCYLPQPATPTNGGPEKNIGKPFSELVHFDIDSPREYCDFIFDRIEETIARKPEHLAKACNYSEVLSNKAAGKKSIILGIENGLALEGRLEYLDHFAQRGITYMTLCHNGDNDICDSAKGNATHGGLSDFGRKVVARLNDLGIMVDLSHAAETSFYDAVEVSRHPIVCSHSNCRALCDHPRNLTDDQLRTLARTGGLAHTTMYPGFLSTCGEADIYDAVRHLKHAIAIMGIEHVGIGTDFDGDGGVPGMADASDVINFTMMLLRKRYGEEDIRLIWGGNWFRLMEEVQV